MAGDEKVTVRRAAAGDAMAIATLSTELGYPVDRESAAKRLETALESRDDEVLVAEEAGGRVVGWIHVFAARRLESDPFAEIGGLVVSRDARRHGLGRRLVDRAHRWAAERSLGRLRVRSNVARDAAHAFYPGLGFERIKDQAVYERFSTPGSADETG